MEHGRQAPLITQHKCYTVQEQNHGLILAIEKRCSIAVHCADAYAGAVDHLVTTPHRYRFIGLLPEGPLKSLRFRLHL